MIKEVKGPKGYINLSGSIPQAIRRKVLKEDGTSFTQMMVSQVINEKRGNVRIKKMYERMCKIKDRRNKAIQRLIDKMIETDEKYLQTLENVIEK